MTSGATSTNLHATNASRLNPSTTNNGQTESVWTTNQSMSSFGEDSEADCDISQAKPKTAMRLRLDSNRIVIREPSGENVSKLTREIDSMLMVGVDFRIY